MPFENELRDLLPADLPERDSVIVKGAEHLRLIEETNRQFNLTRITSPRESAIKHVVDSVIPWRLFADTRNVLDAGTGAGFPGIPLALVLPGVRFTLSESIQKKARFVEYAVQALGISNIVASSQRAEDLLGAKPFEMVTLRAVAPLARAIPLFAKAIRAGSRVLAYKGPDVQAEIDESREEAARHRVKVTVILRYQLPEGLGSRTIVELGKLGA
jgi:16S rRNA (guanine527-N7)-methyltransferase